jgi:hypothetical protein
MGPVYTRRHIRHSTLLNVLGRRGAFALLITLIPVLFFSCYRDESILCTSEYRMLTISIRNSASNPVHLTSYFTRKVSTGEIFNYAAEDPYLDSLNRLDGVYFLFNDSGMGFTAKSGTAFEFHGLIDTAEVVRETYIIGNDGCHVNLVSGTTEIVLP